jgi:hypothetical protein
MTSDSMPLREPRTVTQPMRSSSPECRGPLCQGRRWPGLRRVDAKIAKETRNFRERPDALLASSISGASGCSAASARRPLWAPHLNWPVVTSDRPFHVANCQANCPELSTLSSRTVKHHLRQGERLSAWLKPAGGSPARNQLSRREGPENRALWCYSCCRRKLRNTQRDLHEAGHMT